MLLYVHWVQIDPFSSKGPVVFPQMDFWSIKRKKCGRKKASPFRLTAGEFWMCCQWRPQDELEERQRERWLKRSSNISALWFPQTGEKLILTFQRLKVHCQHFSVAIKRFIPKNKNNSGWNINTNHISWVCSVWFNWCFTNYRHQMIAVMFNCKILIQNRLNLQNWMNFHL